VILVVTPENNRRMGLVDRVQKLTSFASLRKLTPQEYAENLFYTIVTFETVNADEIDCVFESVPEHARSALVDHIDVMLADDFRYPDLHYGGPGPSDEERERLRLIFQQRAKAFANLLRERFDALETQ
jgi:hypothetical protein